MDLATQFSKNMEELLAHFDTRMEEYEKGDQLQSQPGAPQMTVKALSADYLTFKNYIWKCVSMLKKQLELLVSCQDRNENHSRRKMLLFHGIPETDGENVERTVLAVLRDQMKMTDIGALDLEVCHRLGVKKDRTRPVLVRFINLKHRSAVWNTKTSLKGSDISISEFLTKSRQEVFAAARKHFGMKHCWSSEGTIVILLPDKSRRKIVSMSELLELTSQYPANKSSDEDQKRSRRAATTSRNAT